MDYQFRTLWHLFQQSQFENNRINKEDKARTKALLKKELNRRLSYAIKALDEAETETAAQQIYKQFINPRYPSHVELPNEVDDVIAR